MQKYILLLVPFIIFCAPVILNAQNTAPQVNINNINFDAAKNQCTINYSITDNEQEEVEISVALSRDEGTTFLFPIENIEGIGTVETNKELTLTITVNTDSLDRYDLSADDLLFKIMAEDNNAIDINAVVNRVTPELLQTYMGQIEGIRHRTAGRDQYLITRNLIESLVMNSNFQNRSQTFNFDGAESKNVMGRKAGHKEEGSTYMISAHYDTVDESPGADDNGSGVCGLLAALEILKDYQFEKSILIAAFDNEEDESIGSNAFVDKNVRAYENISGLINLKMIGYYSEEANSQTFPPDFKLLFGEQAAQIEASESKGDFIFNVANTESLDLMNAFNSAALTYVPNLKVIALETLETGLSTDYLRNSDHAPFWDAGYPALMITDGANYRNPYYHSAEDKSEHLNFEFMSQVVKATLAAIAQKAGIVSLGYAEGSFGNKVSVPVLHTEPGFAFVLNGNGKNRLVEYILPKQINNGQLLLSNMKGQTIKTYFLNTNSSSIEVELPSEGLYVLAIRLNGYQTFTKRVVYY